MSAQSVTQSPVWGNRTASDTPRIRVANAAPGMVLDFEKNIGHNAAHPAVFVEEAEIVHVETPDGLGDMYGLYVVAEGTTEEIYLPVYGWQNFAIVG